MADWFSDLAALQGEIVRSLAAELRSGGHAAALAYALGALHALTPGHGKAALGTYFLGTEARLAKCAAVALWAALLHVLSGFVVFLVLRFRWVAPFAMGRPSAVFSLAGYLLIGLVGLMMLIQSPGPPRILIARMPHRWRRSAVSAHDLGPRFRLGQSTAPMVALMLLSLTAGIATTIGTVALAILFRSSVGPL